MDERTVTLTQVEIDIILHALGEVPWWGERLSVAVGLRRKLKAASLT